MQEHIFYRQQPLRITNHYKYLGVTFQTTGTYFSRHAKETSITAIRAINAIGYINRLSLETSKQLFIAKVIPILTYGIQITWSYMKKKDLELLEKVKATFLKRALGISKRPNLEWCTNWHGNLS